ncbi:HtaA domain-containing protein [Actinokineospora terrae]|uniref:Htaa protein n=1 Tax=Actinokineospora terrae TaxID=155974 RepID=A0A1H9KSM7_9PSEU|nr:HtaA domain-containing protein [Actinokineospora terrae]SER02194.1 Htaa protein [Actinokineospora terrae]
MSVSLVTGAMLLAVLTPTSAPVTTTTATPPVQSVRETTTTPSTTTSAPGCDLNQANARKGDLVWGFKKSFRQYVGVGLAGATGNSITATNGATITALDEVVRDGVPNPAGIPTGAYRFTFDSADYTSPTRFTSRYRGTVAFSYPAHFFTLLLSDPWVTTANGTATLHADIELKATPGAPAQPANLPDVALARLTPPAATAVNGLLTWPDVPATLTSSEAFAGFYQAGAPLDPPTMTLAADCATTPTAPPTANPVIPTATTSTENLIPVARFRPTPDLASTGVDAEHGLWAGVVLLLAGLALVLAAYRPRRT